MAWQIKMSWNSETNLKRVQVRAPNPEWPEFAFYPSTCYKIIRIKLSLFFSHGAWYRANIYVIKIFLYGEITIWNSGYDARTQRSLKQEILFRIAYNFNGPETTRTNFKVDSHFLRWWVLTLSNHLEYIFFFVKNLR